MKQGIVTYEIMLTQFVVSFFSSLAARYSFVEFNDDNVARQALESLNGQTIPGTSGV